jgi:PST family polysaccharide transporter
MKKTPIGHDSFEVGLDLEGLQTKSIRGVFFTGISQGIRFSVQFVSQLVLARLLLPADYGLLAMAYPVLGLVQIFNDIGLGQSVIQRQKLVAAEVSALFWINVAVSCILTCVLLLLGPVSAWIYGEPRVSRVIMTLAVILPITSLTIIPNSLLARHMKFSVIARNDIVVLVVSTGTVLISALLGLSYWSIVAGQIAASFTSLPLAWISSSWRPQWPSLTKSLWRDMKFGGNLTIANLSSFVIASGDNFIVGVTLGRVALGLYDRSYTLVVQPILQLMAPITKVAVPLLSRLQDDPAAYRTAYIQILRAIILILVPLMLACIVNGSTYISVLLGSRWVAAGPVFSWICLGGLTSGPYSSALWIFISQGRTRELRQVSMLAALLNVLSFLAGSFWGVVGVAAAGATVFVFITTPLLFWAATRNGPVSTYDILKAIIYPVFMSAITLCALYVQQRIAGHGIGVAQCLISGALAYCVFYALALVDRNQRSLICKAGGALIPNRS